MGPPLNHPTPHMDGKTLQRMKEEQETFAQQVVERDGIAIWRAWCLDRKFEDGDWITPEKLTAYVDCEIPSRERTVVPTQSVVGSFVRPVLRLWGNQTAGKSSAGSSESGGFRLQEFSKQIQTLAKSSSIDLSVSPSLHSSISKPGLDRTEESVISELKQAQEAAKAKGITGMLVDPLLAKLLQDQTRFIQALVASASPAHTATGPALPPISPSSSHHHMSPSPVAARPTARSKRHPSQKNKITRFQADKIETPVWYGKDRFTKLKPGRIYRMSPNVKTVQDVLVEWLEGFESAPSIQELNTKYRTQWRGTDDPEKRLMYARSCIVREFKRLVLEDGKTEKEALELMEKDLSGCTLRTYADSIRTRINEGKRRQKLVKATRKGAAPLKTTASPPRGGSKHHKVDPGDESGEDRASESSSAEESDQSAEENNNRTDSTPGMTARRTTTQTALRDARRSTMTKAKHPDFPFPVNELENVADIWQEWYKGWKGDPPLEQLIEQHGRLFYRDKFSRYKHMFYAKQKIVRTLDQLIQDGFTEKDAIEKMEYYREGRKPQTLAAALHTIDWTGPLPSTSRRHSTPRQQHVDTQEETMEQEQPQHEQLQHEQLQQEYRYQAAEVQYQGAQRQLQDHSHHNITAFQGVHHERDDHAPFTDMVRSDVRSEMNVGGERAELDSVSAPTRPYELSSFMSPHHMAIYAERPKLEIVSDVAGAHEQDTLMASSTIGQLNAIKQLHPDVSGPD
ncbi:hypothetical protein BGZ70_005885 [Mortierella alpina]|uniref:Transcription activator GCR1-like domain-containing protein n=1 Tax=Mortierella alpina TaxID=64518 RepID=A0A9P6M6V9_MORAP|nr:hypothetical protein BGZ70_005885 [Mortierella alpina]